MTSTPPRAASPKTGRSTPRTPRTPLSLDLSNLPPFSQPAPPSNTLLITNLNSLAIFHPASLATIRQYITTLVPNELHSFSPLRSFRRIVCSFYSTEAAVKVRQELDGTTFLGANSPVSPTGDEAQEHANLPLSAEDHEVRARIYFGEPTPIDNSKHYLDKPDAGKLFFISPPPSPPVGWESTREGPPNTQTHATDLQSALEKLGSKIRDSGSNFGKAGQEEDSKPELEVQVNDAAVSGSTVTAPTEPRSATSATSRSGTRTRSSSTTMIYDPEAHATGKRKGLPSVMVEDTTYSGEEESEAKDNEGAGPQLDDGKRIIAHTTRPPVELME